MMENLISSFIVLWAAIDPVGTVPVFIAVTKNYSEAEKRKIAYYATFFALFVLGFFLIMGQFILEKMGVPLPAFQISGGVILFLFAVDMIFGDSKPESEIALATKSGKETAIFPLAMPSIAGPGAILAVVLLTDNSRHSIQSQAITAGVMVFVVFINFIVMRASGAISKFLGVAGAILISKVMGLILASIAATNILLGIKDFFKI
ncbi:MAG: MarC family protein [Bacteriovoracaceae bacterium]|nr:MarC family protein [Bacteriovoracaceae bacterium]